MFVSIDHWGVRYGPVWTHPSSSWKSCYAMTSYLLPYTMETKVFIRCEERNRRINSVCLDALIVLGVWLLRSSLFWSRDKETKELNIPMDVLGRKARVVFFYLWGCRIRVCLARGGFRGCGRICPWRCNCCWVWGLGWRFGFKFCVFSSLLNPLVEKLHVHSAWRCSASCFSHCLIKS